MTQWFLPWCPVGSPPRLNPQAGTASWTFRVRNHPRTRDRDGRPRVGCGARRSASGALAFLQRPAPRGRAVHQRDRHPGRRPHRVLRRQLARVGHRSGHRLVRPQPHRPWHRRLRGYGLRERRGHRERGPRRPVGRAGTSRSTTTGSWPPPSASTASAALRGSRRAGSPAGAERRRARREGECEERDDHHPRNGLRYSPGCGADTRQGEGLGGPSKGRCRDTVMLVSPVT